MATLYVENVPEDLYQALRDRARQNRRSIAAEILSMLEDNVPTKIELERRQKLFGEIQQLYSERRLSRRRFPSTEEMQREDRAR